ncbi:ABC transporter ATP-binding protein [Sinomicrobium oceani]|uniref:ABC transporter ATP-binding protein n=1 Tax=Sinomicrobium oceani TaxID=1150368 RepID=UPI002279F645|nr:ABC transporter ATP-binding protein [Sinomicrobium oceani]
MIRFFSNYLYPYKFNLLVLLVLILGASLSALATPYVLKIIIDDIFPNGTYHDLIKILAALLGIYVFRIASSFFSSILYTKISRAIVSDIRVSLFKSILYKNLLFFHENKMGELVFLITNDVENIQDAITSLVLDVLNNIITIIGILIMLFILNMELTLISITIIPLILFIIQYFTPKIRKSFTAIQLLDGDIYNFFLERLKNIKVLKVCNTIKDEINNAIHTHKELVSLHVKNASYKSLSNNISTFIIACGPLIVLIYGGKQVFENTMTLGALIAFIQYLNKLYTPSIGLISSFNDFTKAKVSMDRVYKHVKDYHINHNDYKKRNNTFTYTKPSAPIESLCLENISIKYKNKTVLKNLNVKFEKGKIYGIIGESGSGKSSIINLICGFILPSSGRLLINNDEIDKHYLLQNISLIEKENQLFHGSILSNITYGYPIKKYTPEVKNAIKHAMLCKVLDNLDDGVNTIINDSGSILSDGQKQRISIARAFLQNPSILIFDEATSSLDNDTEGFILKFIQDNYAQNITFFITHRPSSLKYCDTIYQIKDKNLVLIDKKVLNSSINIR